MTRIIAGLAGSLALVTPGSATRPTSDRVREAWFSKLDANGLLDTARVLDLYAGSGALGLEAASRGARSVTMVDNHRAAITAISTNVRALSPVLTHSPGLTVVKNSVAAFLHSAPAGQYDLVFLDPPYDAPSDEMDSVLDALLPALAPRAWVMLERSSRARPPRWPEGLVALEMKIYGDTVLYFAEKS